MFFSCFVFVISRVPPWCGHDKEGEKGMEPFPDNMSQMRLLGTFKQVYKKALPDNLIDYASLEQVLQATPFFFFYFS